MNAIRDSIHSEAKSNSSRRSFVIATASLIGLGGLSVFDRLTQFDDSTALNWDIEHLVLSPDAPFDLAKTLPASVRAGGRFSVSEHGTPLPLGVSLSEQGILTVDSDQYSGGGGIVFQYTEPKAGILQTLLSPLFERRA